MKANLPQREPEMLARWEQAKLYEKIMAARATRRCSSCMTARRSPMATCTSARR